MLYFISGRFRGHLEKEEGGVLIHVRQRQHVSRRTHTQLHTNTHIFNHQHTAHLCFIRVAGHIFSAIGSLRRLFSRVVCYSNMGKRSRQRQRNQSAAGRDDRDKAVRFHTEHAANCR